MSKNPTSNGEHSSPCPRCQRHMDHPETSGEAECDGCGWPGLKAVDQAQEARPDGVSERASVWERRKPWIMMADDGLHDAIKGLHKAQDYALGRDYDLVCRIHESIQEVEAIREELMRRAEVRR